MKQIYIFLWIIILAIIHPSISHAQILSDEVRSSIASELDQLFNESIKAAENLEPDRLSISVDDRHKAGFIVNGTFYSDFEPVIRNYRAGIQGVKSQQISVSQKKITVVSQNVGLIAAAGSNVVYLNDGRTFATYFAWTFVYEKIGGTWKVIQSHQSSEQK